VSVLCCVGFADARSASPHRADALGDCEARGGGEGAGGQAGASGGSVRQDSGATPAPGAVVAAAVRACTPAYGGSLLLRVCAQESTGITTIDEMVSAFVTSEDRNYAVLTMINDLNQVRSRDSTISPTCDRCCMPPDPTAHSQTGVRHRQPWHSCSTALLSRRPAGRYQ